MSKVYIEIENGMPEVVNAPEYCEIFIKDKDIEKTTGKENLKHFKGDGSADEINRQLGYELVDNCDLNLNLGIERDMVDFFFDKGLADDHIDFFYNSHCCGTYIYENHDMKISDLNKLEDYTYRAIDSANMEFDYTIDNIITDTLGEYCYDLMMSVLTELEVLDLEKV